MARILHFGKYYFPDAGGIESVTTTLARSTAAVGHDTDVLCFQKSGASETSHINGVRVMRCAITAHIASQPLSFEYLRSCVTLGRVADIIHVHTPNMLGALGVLLAGSKPKVLVHWHSDVINKGLLGKLLKPLENALLQRADCIVATSLFYADSSEPLRPYRSKVAVVPIGVPSSCHRDRGASGDEAADVFEGQGDLLKGRKMVLAVGRLVPYKGFQVLVEAARTLNKDAVVVIVGDGPERPALMNAIQAFGVADRVFLVGRVTDAILHKLFSDAALYCMSSTNRAEAFGVVLLEAMAYGLPIVATDIPGSGVPWVNLQGVSGVNVPVGDAQALAKACNHILASSQVRKSYSTGARQRFTAEFTEDLFVSRMDACYKRLLTSIPA